MITIGFGLVPKKRKYMEAKLFLGVLGRVTVPSKIQYLSLPWKRAWPCKKIRLGFSPGPHEVPQRQVERRTPFCPMHLLFIPRRPMYFVFCRLYPSSPQPPHGSVWLLPVISLLLAYTVSPVRACINAYPYDWRGFVGPLDNERGPLSINSYLLLPFSDDSPWKSCWQRTGTSPADATAPLSMLQRKSLPSRFYTFFGLCS
jgi:hypothetical protein